MNISAAENLGEKITLRNSLPEELKSFFDNINAAMVSKQEIPIDIMKKMQLILCLLDVRRDINWDMREIYVEYESSIQGTEGTSITFTEYSNAPDHKTRASLISLLLMGKIKKIKVRHHVLKKVKDKDGKPIVSNNSGNIGLLLDCDYTKSEIPEGSIPKIVKYAEIDQDSNNIDKVMISNLELARKNFHKLVEDSTYESIRMDLEENSLQDFLLTNNTNEPLPGVIPISSPNKTTNSITLEDLAA